MRNLSQGYRVVSLLGLGALLMAVSFAYQKDWLEPACDGEIERRRRKVRCGTEGTR